MRIVAIWLIRAYRKWVSPKLPPGVCNMVPSCSAYGLESVQKYGFITGVELILERLLRCREAAHRARPLGIKVHDPVR
jgi:putative membrane protein insertion efficiency factor